MRLVRVSWFDTIEHPTGWYEASSVTDLEDTPLVHSYGLILKENENRVAKRKVKNPLEINGRKRFDNNESTR